MPHATGVLNAPLAAVTFFHSTVGASYLHTLSAFDCLPPILATTFRAESGLALPSAEKKNGHVYRVLHAPAGSLPR